MKNLRSNPVMVHLTGKKYRIKNDGDDDNDDEGRYHHHHHHHHKHHYHVTLI